MGRETGRTEDTAGGWWTSPLPPPADPVPPHVPHQYGGGELAGRKRLAGAVKPVIGLSCQTLAQISGPAFRAIWPWTTDGPRTGGEEARGGPGHREAKLQRKLMRALSLLQG